MNDLAGAQECFVTHGLSFDLTGAFRREGYSNAPSEAKRRSQGLHCGLTFELTGRAAAFGLRLVVDNERSAHHQAQDECRCVSG